MLSRWRREVWNERKGVNRGKEEEGRKGRDTEMPV